MKPLYTQSEFDAAKSLGLLPLECEQCHREFHRTKNDILKSRLPHRRESHRFCSSRCRGDYGITLVHLNCEQCNNPFKKRLGQTKKSKHHFCSQSCAGKWHNAHKTKGTRVSKLERWLQEQLPLLFPGLEFHFNRTDAIEAELDIFIPSLRLAFELNGIFHYEPIYGIKKFASILKNDHRKMLACAEHGIELCVIDTSHEKYFKPAKVQKFLDIIIDIIHQKSEYRPA